MTSAGPRAADPAAGPAAEGSGRLVALPWRTRSDHHCFGCAPGNPHGLALSFRHEDDALVTVLDLGRDYESYPGVVHGGIVSLVCDEAMGNLIVIRDGAVAVTTSLRMRYVGIVRVARAHKVVARITSAREGLIGTTADVYDPDGALVASATATYRPLPESAVLSPATPA